MLSGRSLLRALMTIPRRCACVLCFVVFFVPKTATRPGQIFPFPSTVFTLDNGLTVVGVAYDSPGIIAFYTVVRTGSRNEIEQGFSGYAHFFEHMMFRGTEKYSTEAYNTTIKNIGADSNAFTTDDWTAYHTVASSDALELIIDVESDRFLNLKYSESDFKTEAGAILGEYNLNFSSPVALLRETLHNLAYTQHPYKHTTLGFLEDIEDMPNHYDYSLQFYDRYYRPENCLIIVVGDFEQADLERLTRQYYNEWQRGNFNPKIPIEPKQKEELTATLTWPNSTLPYLMIGYHAPAFSDTEIDMPALDILSQLLFSENAPLFQKLYFQDQVVDILSGGAVDHRDPPLFEILVRITKPDRIDYVRDTILAQIETFKMAPLDPVALKKTTSHMRYSFSMSLNNPNNVARTLAHYMQLTRDAETINRIYRLYEQVTAHDIMTTTQSYFSESNRTIVTIVENESL